MKIIFLTFISLLIVLSSFSQSKNEIQLQLIDNFKILQGSKSYEKSSTSYSLEFNDSLMTIHIKELDYVKGSNFGNMHAEWSSRIIIPVKRLQYIKFIKIENYDYLKFKVFPGDMKDLITTYNMRYKYMEEIEIYINSYNLNDSVKIVIEDLFKQLIKLKLSE